MVFDLDLVPRFELKCVTIEGQGRYYIAPDGTKLDSVTTILGRLPKDQGLIDWRNRVGEEETKAVMRQASDRGTKLHNVLENYILGRKGPKPDSLTRQRFRIIKPILDQHVGRVFACEHVLWSTELKAAGRSDLGCIWDGIPSVVDFKTSNYPKTKENIRNYFLQASAYAHMLRSLYAINISQLVIIIVVERDSPQLFLEESSEWEPHMIQVFGSSP